MNFKTIFSSFFFLKSIFVVSLFLLIFISGITYKHTLALTESSESVVHSYKVHVELEQLLSYIKDAETGQRGYLLTRDSAFLKPFMGANMKANQSFTLLKNLTTDNLLQQNNLDTLYQLINLRFKIMATVLQEKSSEELRNKNLVHGNNIMDSIRSQINNMINLEMVYLQERQKTYQDEVSFTPIFTLSLLLFSVFIFSFSYFNINKSLTILQNANEALIITTESVKHAEEIGEFSTWQWDLQTHKLIYSDNQYRLLGCEPQSFEPTIENFLEFVHPDDRHIITNGSDAVMSTGQPKGAYFRVIRKDGTLRYFKSIGKLLTDKSGKKVLIGINSDITEQSLNSIELEEKNRSLERSNKELDSFNHIASHDLQEPLRKIQTFISRISDIEFAKMSEKGKDYFDRIQVATARMRALIDDLLLFSSTHKSEKVFELLDLDDILENVKMELALEIEEKNAVIEAVPLPTLHAIPFQMQQLFINLIGNSLKYSKPDEAPYIKIDCHSLYAQLYPHLKTNTEKKFYKISIIDNGLGFQQEHAENIFILFRRLHHKDKYAGTGIGLAICKKIVDNHSGFIVAESVPNQGSTFHIYLPE